MRSVIRALGRAAIVLFGGSIAVVANAQQTQQQQMPNKLQYDSTPTYQEHNTTPPAAAAAGARGALNAKPGKQSAGKQPTLNHANGLGMDAGAASMEKKE